MKKLYAGIVLNKDELTESNSNRIELEYYKISKKNKGSFTRKTNLYGIEIVKKEYSEGKKIKEKNENLILRKWLIIPIYGYFPMEIT